MEFQKEKLDDIPENISLAGVEQAALDFRRQLILEGKISPTEKDRALVSSSQGKGSPEDKT